MAGKPADLFLSAVLAAVLFSGLACARMTPPGEVWIKKFDPPYDDRTLKLQLRIDDWWVGTQDTAILPKGTKFPVLLESCNYDVSKCPSWTLPADVFFQYGPPTTQDVHRLNIFLTDTGSRVPIYSAPYERFTSGCSGQANAVCCDGKEYTLQRDETQHAGFKMWFSRFNGTTVSDGTQAVNIRNSPAKLTVRTGYYTGSVSWANVFQNTTGASSDGKLQASISFSGDGNTGSYQDILGALANDYTLFIPLTDPGAPGFVVPNGQLNDSPKALDFASWSACRTAQCGAPLGTCTSGQKATPYTDWQSVTSAKIVADSWNALQRPTTKLCTVLGNGRRQFMESDLSLGATHMTQYISCDYQLTHLVPVIRLPRAVIEAGNTAPPPPSPPPPSPPPPPPPPSPQPTPSGPATTPSPVPVGTNSASSSPPVQPPRSPTSFTALSPPPPVSSRLQGLGISLVTTFSGFSPAEFNATGKDLFLKAIINATPGVAVKPWIRYRSILTPSEARALQTPIKTSRKSLLQLRFEGTLVDSVIYFGAADSTPAMALLTMINTQVAMVFPSTEFGFTNLTRAALLNCVYPCGDNGKPGPRVTASGVSCTCECDPGWSTNLNQPFENFKYCSIWTAPASTSNGTSPGTGTGAPGTPGSSNGTDLVVRSPPPAPVQYKEDNGGGISGGGIVGIVIGMLIAGAVVYIAWKTGCSCCLKVWSNFFVAFWHRCVTKKTTTNTNSGQTGTPAQSQSNYDNEANNEDEDEDTEAPSGTKKKKAPASPKANKAKKKNQGKHPTEAPSVVNVETTSRRAIEAGNATHDASDEETTPKKKGKGRNKNKKRGKQQQQ